MRISNYLSDIKEGIRWTAKKNPIVLIIWGLIITLYAFLIPNVSNPFLRTFNIVIALSFIAFMIHTMIQDGRYSKLLQQRGLVLAELQALLHEINTVMQDHPPMIHLATEMDVAPMMPDDIEDVPDEDF